jgi:hypothetical protein
MAPMAGIEAGPTPRGHPVRCLRGWLSSSRKNGAPGTANTLCRGHREVSRYREAVWHNIVFATYVLGLMSAMGSCVDGA